jgi:hypothetical protein
MHYVGQTSNLAVCGKLTSASIAYNELIVVMLLAKVNGNSMTHSMPSCCGHTSQVVPSLE